MRRWITFQHLSAQIRSADQSQSIVTHSANEGPPSATTYTLSQDPYFHQFVYLNHSDTPLLCFYSRATWSACWIYLLIQHRWMLATQCVQSNTKMRCSVIYLDASDALMRIRYIQHTHLAAIRSLSPTCPFMEHNSKKYHSLDVETQNKMLNVCSCRPSCFCAVRFHVRRWCRSTYRNGRVMARFHEHISVA